MTSHDVVDVVRRTLGTRKVGHAGTLDPMATGLLVLGVGRATRLLRFLGELPKTYEGDGAAGRGDRHAGRRRRGRADDARSTVSLAEVERAVRGAGRRVDADAARVLGREGGRPQALRGGPQGRGARGARRGRSASTRSR